MGCCQTTPRVSTGRPATESIRVEEVDQVEGAQAEGSPIIIEITPRERALAELKRIFEGVHAEDGHRSKAELAESLQKQQELSALLKEAGLKEVVELVRELGGQESELVSWEQLQTCAEKAVVQEAQHEVKEIEQEVVQDFQAGEKALQWVKALFEKLVADEQGAVSKEELATKLQADLQEVGESISKLIVEAGFNPIWNQLEELDTNKDGAVTWEELEVHIRGSSKELEAQVCEAARELEVVIEDAVKRQRCWACC